MVLPLAACTTQRQPRASSELAAVAPALSVERFLQAVNAQDFDSMARIFGTVDGPVEGDRVEVELRMSTLADILRHQDYRIATERLQPGREHPTRRVGVDLDLGNRTVQDVAFMVVQTREGRWMVEEIDLEKVMGR